MSDQYYLVREQDLPEVFLRILAVRKRLETEPGLSVSRACAVCNLSRSAFYKYRDSILPVPHRSRQEVQVRCVFPRDLRLEQTLCSCLDPERATLVFWHVTPVEYPLQQIHLCLQVDQEWAEGIAESFRKALQGLAGLREWTVILTADPFALTCAPEGIPVPL